MLNLKILIVEDDLIIREEIELWLTEQKCQVYTADNTSDVFSVLEKEKIEVVLMDIHLGNDLNGVDLARKIKAQNQVPLIYISNIDHPRTVSEAESTQPSSYLVKPFTKKQLFVSIERALLSNEAPTTNLFDDSIFINTGTENFTKTRILLDDILYLQANRAYSFIVTKAKKHIISKPLRHTLEKMPEGLFIKVHKSYAINPKHVTEIKGNKLVINGEEISIGNSDILKQLRTF